MVDWSRISARSWQVTLLHFVKRSFQIVHDCLILPNQIPKLFNTSIQDYWSYQFSEYLRIRFNNLCSSVCGPSGLDKGIILNRKRKWLNMNRKRNLDDVNRTGRGTYLMWTELKEELTWCEQNRKRNLLDVNRTERGTYLMWTGPEEELTWCEQNRKRNLLDVNRTERGTYLMWTEPEEELTWCEQNRKRNLLDVNRTGRGTYLMWTQSTNKYTARSMSDRLMCLKHNLLESSFEVEPAEWLQRDKRQHQQLTGASGGAGWPARKPIIITSEKIWGNIRRENL